MATRCPAQNAELEGSFSFSTIVVAMRAATESGSRPVGRAGAVSSIGRVARTCLLVEAAADDLAGTVETRVIRRMKVGALDITPSCGNRTHRAASDP